ncbi:hypothetical protein LZ32DRAFT_310165 [Colletotrichum eremochloae]|nr:hypothetical protein LZ32DRAFT_310165 [Colletotrichum eremochloae]
MRAAAKGQIGINALPKRPPWFVSPTCLPGPSPHLSPPKKTPTPRGEHKKDGKPSKLPPITCRQSIHPSRDSHPCPFPGDANPALRDLRAFVVCWPVPLRLSGQLSIPETSTSRCGIHIIGIYSRYILTYRYWAYVHPVGHRTVRGVLLAAAAAAAAAATPTRKKTHTHTPPAVQIATAQGRRHDRATAYLFFAQTSLHATDTPSF